MAVDLSFSRFCNGKSSWEKVVFSLQPNKRHLYNFSLYKLFWFVWANSVVSWVSQCFMFFWETIVNVRYNKMKLKSLKSTDIWISFALQSGDSYPKKWKRNLSTFSFRQDSLCNFQTGYVTQAAITEAVVIIVYKTKGQWVMFFPCQQ